jgi:hypothetical protein
MGCSFHDFANYCLRNTVCVLYMTRINERLCANFVSESWRDSKKSVTEGHHCSSLSVQCQPYFIPVRTGKVLSSPCAYGAYMERITDIWHDGDGSWPLYTPRTAREIYVHTASKSTVATIITSQIPHSGSGGRNYYEVNFIKLSLIQRICTVVTKSGNLNFLEPSGPLQACNGTALPFYTTDKIKAAKITHQLLHFMQHTNLQSSF